MVTVRTFWWEMLECVNSKGRLDNITCISSFRAFQQDYSEMPYPQFITSANC